MDNGIPRAKFPKNFQKYYIDWKDEKISVTQFTKLLGLKSTIIGI
jgi:hypothetical protein